MRSLFAGILVVISANKITKVKIQTNNLWNRHQAQYLIINALETLELLEWRLYDEETGFWRIQSPSPVLPTAFVLPNDDIVPADWISDL